MPKRLEEDAFSSTDQVFGQRFSVTDCSTTTIQVNGPLSNPQTMTSATQPFLEREESSRKVSNPAHLGSCLDIIGFDGDPFAAVQFTPSHDDFTIQDMVDWGWESLDTTGSTDSIWIRNFP